MQLPLEEIPLRLRILLPISGLAMIVPPILPMAMVWSLHWANYRLRHDHKVYCAYPSLIVVAGGINCVCFDKVRTTCGSSRIPWLSISCALERYVRN